MLVAFIFSTLINAIYSFSGKTHCSDLEEAGLLRGKWFSFPFLKSLVRNRNLDTRGLDHRIYKS